MKARKGRKGRKGCMGRPSLSVTPHRPTARPRSQKPHEKHTTSSRRTQISKKKRALPKRKAEIKKVVKRSVGRKAHSSSHGNKARKPSPKLLVRVRDLKAKQKKGNKKPCTKFKSEASMESCTTDGEQQSGTDTSGAGGAGGAGSAGGAGGAGGVTMEERPSSGDSLSVGKKPINGPSNDKNSHPQSSEEN